MGNNMKYFPGIARSREAIYVFQRKYILDLLAETGIMGCCLADTPIESNTKLENSGDKILVEKDKYRRFVGKLIYLSHTRPNISYDVSIVSQFMQAPYEDHMEVVNITLRYSKATFDKGLRFRKIDRRCIDTDSD